MASLSPGVLSYDTEGPVPDPVILRIKFQCMHFEWETDTNIQTMLEPNLLLYFSLPLALT